MPLTTLFRVDEIADANNEIERLCMRSHIAMEVAMTDESELDTLDALTLFDIESERIDHHFASLDDTGWTAPTRCAGWRVREMLSHVRGGELYNRACLAGTVPQLMERAANEGQVHDLDSFTAWINDLYAGRDRDELLAEWRAENAAVRTDLRARGPNGELATMAGAYPVRLQAIHLAMEYATHADDMNAAVSATEADARRDWRARFTRFALRELDKPVSIQRRDGGNVVRLSSDDAGDGEVVLSDHDLAEAGQGRLPAGALTPAFENALRTNG